MSASDEEAFASAEEGETTGASAPSGKSAKTKKAEVSKSQPAAAKDKGGGKAKGKQQQQGKKKTGKVQSKSSADKNERAGVSKTEEEASKSAGNVKRKGEESAGSSEKTDNTSGTTSPSNVNPSLSEPLTSAESSTSTKPVSESEKLESQSETRSVEGNVPKSPATASTPERASSALSKSAGEIQKDLSPSSSAEDTSVVNPRDQAITRDADDAATDSPKKETSEKAEAGGGGEAAGGGGGGGWSWGWGSSLLSAATNSLETFSSQVGEGLTTIIDTVESSLGVPDPEELAQAGKASEPADEQTGKKTVTAQPQEKEGTEEPAGGTTEIKEESEDTASADKEAQVAEQSSQQGGKWLSGWGMSSISNLGKSFVNKSHDLMNTGFEKAETLAAGGLDILETIGKKTYTTLTEHDPGLRRAREFMLLKKEKPSLSSILREAREKSEEEAKYNEEMEEARKCDFTALFEDNQGLAHLEALEMLSNRSERKVQSLLSAMEEETLEGIRHQLMEIKDIFQEACDSEAAVKAEESEQEFSKLVTENLSELHLGTVPDKLNKVQETVRQWIADFYSHEEHGEITDAKEVQQHAIQSLADVTSKAVEQFHKAGELVLMQKDEDKSCTQRAQSLAKLSLVLVTEIDILASKFSQCINKIGEEQSKAEEVGPMVTNVYLEASNASGYIQDAFQLLLPVLQHAAIQSAL